MAKNNKKPDAVLMWCLLFFFYATLISLIYRFGGFEMMMGFSMASILAAVTHNSK